MSNELEFKYEVEIKSVEKRQMLSKEVKEELKESGLMDETVSYTPLTLPTKA